MTQKNAIIEHASFIVDDKDGLMAQTGERAYPIDGLAADKYTVAGFFDSYKEFDEEEFARQCINGFQEVENNMLVYIVVQ